MLEKHPDTKTWLLESSDSGHGAGSDFKDRVDYYTNLYTFFAVHLKLNVAGSATNKPLVKGRSVN